MLFSKGSYARAEALVDTVKSSDTFRVASAPNSVSL